MTRSHRRKDDTTAYRSAMPDLVDLCTNHDVSIELIERSHDIDELLERVLEEYERRLERMSSSALDSRAEPEREEPDGRLRALVMFASQAAALKEKAAAATALQRAFEEQERMRRQLDDVLATLDAAILIVSAEGKIRNANRAAGALTGESPEALLGRGAETYLGRVPRGGDGEVEIGRPGEENRLMLVSRRDLSREGQDEVVLLNDVTEHDRDLQERHRTERLNELFRTLAVLSHKINNPLTSLMGRAQILQMRKDVDPQVRKAADVIDESARRIAAYVRELARVADEGKAGDLDQLLAMDGVTGPGSNRKG